MYRRKALYILKTPVYKGDFRENVGMYRQNENFM